MDRNYLHDRQATWKTEILLIIFAGQKNKSQWTFLFNFCFIIICLIGIFSSWSLEHFWAKNLVGKLVSYLPVPDGIEYRILTNWYWLLSLVIYQS